MTMRGYYSDSTARKDATQRPAPEVPAAPPPKLDTGKQCAYNQSRERFLSADVDAVDFSASSLIDNRLPSVAPGAGLWLNPFVGISPTSVRMPVDLIYLDRECTVVDTVESFPLGRGSAVNPPSVSVLVMPAETIRGTETQLGDQLIVCAPEEMKRRLQKLANPDAETKEAAAARNATGRVLEWDGRTRGKMPAEKSLVEETPAHVAPEPKFEPKPEPKPEPKIEAKIQPTAPAEAPAAPEKGKIEKAKRGWLSRLLTPEPADNRKTERHALPGLAAFFFTGGAPMAHAVRDISLTGMYVFTTERWYPGTMVRMTITDSSDGSAERSITLNTTVVRADDDGVGLRFVLERGKKRQRTNDGLSFGADIEEVQEFMLRVAQAQASQQA
jgi:uncharacterized protein